MFGVRRLIALVLVQFFDVREVPQQMTDQLLLPSGRGTVIRDDLDVLPCRDVLEVATCSTATAAAALRVSIM